MNFNNATHITCANGLAVPVFPENELLQYGYDSFLDDYTNSERTKILKLHGHERITDTPTTISAAYELEYNCHSNGRCSNCSGISCCAIFVKNPRLESFETWLSQQNELNTDAPDGTYPVDEFGEVVWQYSRNGEIWISVHVHYPYDTFGEFKNEYEGVGWRTRQFLPYIGPKKQENNPEWIPLSKDNLPSEMLICEWLHPEYGVIKGNIVRYEPTYKNGNNCVSEWIYPDPEDGSQADIYLWEFTHYRKLSVKPDTPEQKGVKQARPHQWISVGIRMPEIDSVIVIWNLFFNEEMMISFDDKNMLKQFKHWYPTLGEPK